ncbi:MAG: carboxylating nicotinate-nucleotide diphosphorylase [Acidobacteriaceae bacterium]|nr:carboxylating nicotinate-nucleotide diphosphorylase [Acidobacteriaceae bacterium]MBV9295581.1 carboxylating nicotinate-nucleotide diphosphorylase [Acidobacteriaceae bacterium]MBV9766547.1 carboxylating nicotinate-nucleotide diphosphorylase [Acidobacteriaceae bacterium]
MFDISNPDVRGVVERALAEDIGSGDITSDLTIPKNLTTRGSFIAKQSLVLAGIELLPLIYELRGGASVQLRAESGSKLSSGSLIATVAGRARTLLECERVALNFLQRLSGVATLARKYIDAVEGTAVRILDTRKTTPGLRQLEKMAAAAGGATNHRRGLFDAVLIKNNHITAAGGVLHALERTKGFTGPVEIEVRTRAEMEEALSAGAKHLLLDNLSPVEAAEWIRKVNGRATIELSGCITLENIRAYAEAGPNFISCGAITHSATAVDISFRLEPGDL